MKSEVVYSSSGPALAAAAAAAASAVVPSPSRSQLLAEIKVCRGKYYEVYPTLMLSSCKSIDYLLYSSVIYVI